LKELSDSALRVVLGNLFQQLTCRQAKEHARKLLLLCGLKIFSSPPLVQELTRNSKIPVHVVIKLQTVFQKNTKNSTQSQSQISCLSFFCLQACTRNMLTTINGESSLRSAVKVHFWKMFHKT